MEVLAYIAIALVLILIGYKLSQYLHRKYSFTTFSGRAIGLIIATAIAWTLTYYYFDPDSADNPVIILFAWLFVISLDVGIPMSLLASNIRRTNFFWGLFAFVYQILATVSAVIFLLLLIARFSDYGKQRNTH